MAKESNYILNSEREDSGEISLLFAKEYPKRKTVGLKEACSINKENNLQFEKKYQF